MNNDLAENQVNNNALRWGVVVAGFMQVFIFYGLYYCFGVFLKPMLADLGWSRATISMALSLYMLTNGACSIMMGTLSDKFGPKVVVSTGTFFIAAGYILTSRITQPWELYIVFSLITGVGMSTGYVPVISTVSKWFVKKRGFAVGIVGAGVGLGQMIIPVLMRYLISLYGWRTAYVIMGSVILCIGTPAALLLKQPNTKKDIKPLDDIEKTSVNDRYLQYEGVDFSASEAIKTLSFWLLLYIFISIIFGVSVIVNHLVSHVTDIGFSPIEAALILAFVGGSGIFGRIFIGLAADKAGSKIMLSGCIVVLTILFAGLIYADKLWLIYIISLFFGLGYGGSLPVVIKMSTDFFGITSAGTIFGLLIFGATFGGAFGVTLSGYIYDITGTYIWAFIISSIIMSIAFFISLIIKSPAKKNKFKI